MALGRDHDVTPQTPPPDQTDKLCFHDCLRRGSRRWRRLTLLHADQKRVGVDVVRHQCLHLLLPRQQHNLRLLLESIERGASGWPNDVAKHLRSENEP